VPHVFEVRLLPRRDVVYRDNGGFDLTIDHLPTDRAHVMEHCRITEQNNFQLESTVIAPGQPVHLHEDLPPPGVELITVREVPQGASAPAPRAASYCSAQ
jgi:hypothetical protein